jgi:hypothetical protein
VHLTYAFCDDWLIYAKAPDGSWWMTNTETWPEWADAAEAAGVDLYDLAALGSFPEGEDGVHEHMVPRVTAWNTELSPTASMVSHAHGGQLRGAKVEHAHGTVGFPAWEPVPAEDWTGLAARANANPEPPTRRSTT